MFDFINKVASKNSRSEKSWSLNEVLAILQMIDSQKDKKYIAEATGRSLNSLNYKIYERQITVEEKTQVRSIQKFWYKDPTSPQSELVDTPTALRKLYQSFKISPPETDEELEGDVEQRVAQWIEENFTTISQVSGG